MPHISLQEVREHDSSSESIRQAFFRLDDARAEATADLARLQQARPASLLTASVSEIDKIDERARRISIFIEQLDLLEPELKAAFVAAKTVEQDADFATKHAAVKATIAAWNEEVRAKYTKMAAQLVPLLERGLAIQVECVALRDMPTYRRAPAWSRPEDPLDEMLVGLMAVRLPGLEPGDKHVWGN